MIKTENIYFCQLKNISNYILDFGKFTKIFISADIPIGAKLNKIFEGLVLIANIKLFQHKFIYLGPKHDGYKNSIN